MKCRLFKLFKRGKRIITIKLYDRNATSPLAWAHKESKVKICVTGITIWLVLYWNRLPMFVIYVPNKTFSDHNPFRCLMKAMESESIAAQKYMHLKDAVREIDCWQRLP